MNAAALHLLHEEFAKLTGAGFGLRKAVETLILHQSPHRKILQRMAGRLNAGGSLAEALKAGGFPELDVAMVRSGERGGKIPQAFAHLGNYYKTLARGKREASLALIYPFALLHLGLIAGDLPLGLIHGKSLGSILLSTLPELVMLYGIAIIIYFMWRLISNLSQHHAKLDTVANSLPLVGKARRNLAMTRFTRVWHMALLAGISLRETISVAAGAARSGAISNACETLQQALSRGALLGPAIMDQRAFPADFARSFASAEQSGTLDDDLARWSVEFENKAADAIKITATVFPKMIYLCALAYVAWKIIGFWSGYYEGIIDQLEIGE